MLFSLFHFLSGYCRVVLSGMNQERFLNLCAAKQILLWNIKKEGKHYIFYISRGGYKELQEISEKTGSTFRCIQKKGIPYLFCRYKKRKCFVLALLFCTAIFIVMSCFIWQVQVTGSYGHSEEELLDYLEKKGVHSGTKISGFSCARLEEQIRKDFEDIAWVSCERKGTLLRVRVKETLDKRDQKEGEKQESPCNLIASKKGRIEVAKRVFELAGGNVDFRILLKDGTKVKKGDKVKPGDVLISGVVEIKDDAGEIAEETLVRAQGDVYAISKIKYEDHFPLIYYKKNYTGKTEKSYRFLINGYTIKMPERKTAYAEYDEQSREILLHIGPQFYLPVSLFIITKAQCQISKESYSVSQAKKEARKRLFLFLKEYERKGVVILKNNVRIDSDKNECTAKGIIKIKERVGKVQEISSTLNGKKDIKQEPAVLNR